LGWKEHVPSDLYDAGVGIGAALLLFVTGTLSLSAFKRMSWDMLILLGGSLSLAAVVKESGLSTWLAGLMGGVGTLHPLALMLAVTTLTVFISAFTSNMATTTLMLNIVRQALPGGLSKGDVLGCLSGVTIAASCDFMLPAGTPPNAIVFGTRYIRMRTMAGAGFVLDLAAAILVALWVYFGANPLLSWAGFATN
jgi:sodium-dependent dicarboxylate transporter 2/3/5